MNDYRGTTTFYFQNESDAEDARDDLLDVGVPEDAISLESHGTSSGFMESLKRFFGMDAPEDYTGTLLMVDDLDGASEAMAIVRRHGGRAQGDYSAMERTEPAGADLDEERRMRLREERLSVNKQTVGQGEVRVRKEVVTENQKIDVPVTHEEVYIERRNATGPSDDDSEIAEGEEIRIPVTREEVSVDKRPVTTEEVAVGKRKVEEKQTVGATVRKERARVDTEGDVRPKDSNDSIG